MAHSGFALTGMKSHNVSPHEKAQTGTPGGIDVTPWNS